MNTETQEFNYAGFWRRFAASVLDETIIFFFTTFLIAPMMNHFIYGVRSNEVILIMIWGGFYFTIFRWCYFAGMESSPMKATIGKLAVGLYVTNISGERITFGQATGRFFGKIISGLILYIGYIIAAFNKKKQAVHDLMSNCLVLKK